MVPVWCEVGLALLVFSSSFSPSLRQQHGQDARKQTNTKRISKPPRRACCRRSRRRSSVFPPIPTPRSLLLLLTRATASASAGVICIPPRVFVYLFRHSERDSDPDPDPDLAWLINFLGPSLRSPPSPSCFVLSCVFVFVLLGVISRSFIQFQVGSIYRDQHSTRDSSTRDQHS